MNYAEVTSHPAQVSAKKRFSAQKISSFRRKVRAYYGKYRRDFPWRHTYDPYAVLVSEIMLQQTQASRVAQKFSSFLEHFPTVQSLASARQSDVLREWQGLGYNRRALRLKQVAEKLVADFKGILPGDPHVLCTLPGIGWNTAAAICVYAFNKPIVYIETNIRRIIIHDFFPKAKLVGDDRVLPLIQTVIDRRNPREWYWALMDYGAHLPRVVDNPNRRSKHYTKHPPFKGSNRDFRGRLLRLLVEHKKLKLPKIAAELDVPERAAALLVKELEGEGFIKKYPQNGWSYALA